MLVLRETTTYQSRKAIYNRAPSLPLSPRVDSISNQSRELTSFVATLPSMPPITPPLLLLNSLAPLPFSRSNWVDVGNVHSIDVLQRTTSSFYHKEVDNPNQAERTASENQAIKVADVLGNKCREKGDQEVPKPVRSGGQPNRGSPVARWIEFSNNSPAERSPGDCEGDDEEAGKHNHHLSGLCIVRPIVVREFVMPDKGENE